MQEIHQIIVPVDFSKTTAQLVGCVNIATSKV